MSKRYGRNQKRAHRTRIAELEKELAATREHAARLDRDCREYNAEIATAKRIVGEYCVAFEPRTQVMHFKSADFATVMHYEREHGIGLGRYWDFNRDPTLQPMRVEQIRLPIMCALASEDIRRMKHVNVAYDGKVYGYAIDPGVFHCLRYPAALAQTIADRLVVHIHAEISKDYQPEPRRTHTRDEPAPRQWRPELSFPSFR
jgi:hypothetical protein